MVLLVVSGVPDHGQLDSQLLTSLKAEHHGSQDTKLPTLCHLGERRSDRKGPGMGVFSPGQISDLLSLTRPTSDSFISKHFFRFLFHQ